MSDDRPTKHAPGVVVALYNSDRPDQALTPRVLDVLSRAMPEAVCLHGGPRAILGQDPGAAANRGYAPVAAVLRARWPGLALVGGIGCDSWTAAYAAGKKAEALGWLTRAAGFFDAIGSDLLVWDAEAASEAHPTEAADLARRLIQAVAAAYPRLVQAFTSFSNWTGHARVPWLAWHSFPVALTLPQVYVVGDGHPRAAPGELTRLEARAQREWAEAPAKGVLPAAGVQVGRYLQLYGTPQDELAAVAAKAPRVFWWALPHEADDEGLAALYRCCDARRAGVGKKQAE